MYLFYDMNGQKQCVQHAMVGVWLTLYSYFVESTTAEYVGVFSNVHKY